MADVVIAQLIAGDLGKMGLFQGQISDDRVFDLPAPTRIAIPPCSSFLAQFAKLDHAIGNRDVAAVRVSGGIKPAPVGEGDIQP